MKEKLTLPISIIIAGLLIAGGIYLNGKITRDNPSPASKEQLRSQNLAEVLRPIDANDHILGDSKARVLIVEYSDTECPFCKSMHASLLSIMQEYGAQGKVAWVYRHFPITDLHSKAFKEAEATECAGNLGGNGKFWEYINKIYEVTPSNNGLDPKELSNIAVQVGLSSSAFNTCLESGEFGPRVNLDVQNANELEGSDGPFTPYSIIIDTQKKEYYPLNGYVPRETIKSAIDLILQS